MRLSAPDELSEPLSLLEESLRYGEPVPPPFAGQLARAVERGNLELLAAWADGGPVGVIVLAYRPSISLGATFASIEDLYVKPDAGRRKGTTRGGGGAVQGAPRLLCRSSNRRSGGVLYVFGLQAGGGDTGALALLRLVRGMGRRASENSFGGSACENFRQLDRCAQGAATVVVRRVIGGDPGGGEG